MVLRSRVAISACEGPVNFSECVSREFLICELPISPAISIYWSWPEQSFNVSSTNPSARDPRIRTLEESTRHRSFVRISAWFYLCLDCFILFAVYLLGP